MFLIPSHISSKYGHENLATRLAKVISSLVDVDQTGFMPGKSTDTSLTTCLLGT